MAETATAIETAATTDAAPAPTAKASEPKFGYWWGTGRRKAAIASVRIRPGSGKYEVNGRDVNVYFTELRDQQAATAPLRETKTEGKIDVFVKAHGGGYMGQAGAVKLGIARALKNYDPSLEPILREHDFLTRDPREVERKKYGQRGARRRFQFSKR